MFAVLSWAAEGHGGDENRRSRQGGTGGLFLIEMERIKRPQRRFGGIKRPGRGGAKCVRFAEAHLTSATSVPQAACRRGSAAGLDFSAASLSSSSRCLRARFSAMSPATAAAASAPAAPVQYEPLMICLQHAKPHCPLQNHEPHTACSARKGGGEGGREGRAGFVGRRRVSAHTQD